MKKFNINLCDKYGFFTGKSHASLSVYLNDNFACIDNERKHPAIIICPGGAYIDHADRENEPVALYFLSKGFQVFVLKYSVHPIHYPMQLLEIAASVDYIRTNARDFLIDENKIFTIGFSAGGHLAAMSGILWKEDIIKEYINTNLMNAKPNGVILCYPVVSGRICSERINAFDYLLGKENINQYDELSLENRVDKDSVPAFIWHTFTDVTVPVQSAIVLAEAYNKAGVKFELHIFSDGVHGLALANDVCASDKCPQYYNEQVEEWKILLDNWLRKEYNIKK